ncbi:15460_t:CDS:2 [Funneliformis geosporum]|nr:15460_t:CDS:2 [Funneliformis geosporum]
MSGGKRVPKGETFSDEKTDYFYLRPNEVSIRGIDKDNIPYLSAKIYNQLKRYKIVSGELCVSIAGTIGKTALINTDNLEIGKENLILSENFIKLTSKQEIVKKEYTIKPTQKLGIDKWKHIKVPSISLPKQEKIVNEIKNELDKQEEAKKEAKDKRNKIDEIITDYLKKDN